MDAATLELLEGPMGNKTEIDWLVKIHTRDGRILAPGEDSNGESPKVDDL